MPSGGEEDGWVGRGCTHSWTPQGRLDACPPPQAHQTWGGNEGLKRARICQLLWRPRRGDQPGFSKEDLEESKPAEVCVCEKTGGGSTSSTAKAVSLCVVRLHPCSAGELP